MRKPIYRTIAAAVVLGAVALSAGRARSAAPGGEARPAAAEAPLRFEKDVPEDVTFQKDVVYGKVGEDELKLNLSTPKGAAEALPCIVVLHGGGWAAGDRSQHNNITWMFAQHGYVSATVGYRFAPMHPYPAAIEDVKCAVRYLRAHAKELHIDPERMGAVGFSAGAHLAMMLDVMDKGDGLDDSGGSAGISSKVQAAVSFFGPTDMTRNDFPAASTKILQTFFGAPYEQMKAQYKAASPVTYLSAGDGPILMYQGSDDALVPWSQATIMLEAMAKVKVSGRAELISGAGHGWGGAELLRTMDGAYHFFEENVKHRLAPKPPAGAVE